MKAAFCSVNLVVVGAIRAQPQTGGEENIFPSPQQPDVVADRPDNDWFLIDEPEVASFSSYKTTLSQPTKYSINKHFLCRKKCVVMRLRKRTMKMACV